MTDRLYIGNWIFNNKRTSSQIMPGAYDKNIDLAAWISDAIADGLIDTGVVPSSPDGNGIYGGSGTINEDTNALLGEYALAIGSISDFPEFSYNSGFGNQGPPNIGLYIDNRYLGFTYTNLAAGANALTIDERYGFKLSTYKDVGNGYERGEFFTSLGSNSSGVYGVEFKGDTITTNLNKKSSSYFKVYASDTVVSDSVQHGISFGSGPTSVSTIPVANRISTWFTMGNIDVNSIVGSAQDIGATQTISNGFSIGGSSPASANRPMITGLYTNNASGDTLTLFNKYQLPNQTPSSVSGKVSIVVWTGNGSTNVASIHAMADSYVDSAAAVTGGVAIGELWYNTTSNKFNVRLS